MGKWLKTLQSIARDLLILASIASIFHGAYLIYQPAAFIIGGLIMFWIAIPGRKAGK